MYTLVKYSNEQLCFFYLGKFCYLINYRFKDYFRNIINLPNGLFKYLPIEIIYGEFDQAFRQVSTNVRK